MRDQLFGPPGLWPGQDLIAFSTEFDPWLAEHAYRCGVFPMPLSFGDFGGEMGWWSPVARGVLPLDGLRVTRSLRQSARRYTTTWNECFDAVLAECANPHRPGGWIDEDIARVYRTLHDRGVVCSVETWDDDGRLVGGLYGVAINGLFAGESMFHDATHGRDASKVALLRLVNDLLSGGGDLLDVQWATPHLEALGAVEVDRDDYLSLLSEALDRPAIAWSPGRVPGGELAARF